MWCSNLRGVACLILGLPGVWATWLRKRQLWRNFLGVWVYRPGLGTRAGLRFSCSGQPHEHAGPRHRPALDLDVGAQECLHMPERFFAHFAPREDDVMDGAVELDERDVPADLWHALPYLLHIKDVIGATEFFGPS